MSMRMVLLLGAGLGAGLLASCQVGEPPATAGPVGDAPIASTLEPVSSPQPPARESPSPAPTDLLPGPFYVDETEMIVLESYPYQVRMIVRGSLPTPCATLHWVVADPDERGRIDVEVYSLSDPDLACIQVLHPTEVTIPLGSFTSGSFTVWLNGEKVAELDL